MNTLEPVKTPCIGVCSTGLGDDVCRGCKRFKHEVIDWNAYTHAQQYIIEQRLAGFLSQLTQQVWRIVDERRLPKFGYSFCLFWGQEKVPKNGAKSTSLLPSR